MRPTSPLALLSILALVAACGDSGADGAGGGGAGGGGPGGSGAGGGSGACLVDEDCASTTGNARCVYADGLCGDGDGKTCVEVGASCGESPARTVCGCDGTTSAESVSCIAEEDTRAAACAPPDGRFFCGGLDCALDGDTYCDLVGGVPTCAPVPEACADADDLCACLVAGGGSCECELLADGHAELGCYL